VSSRLGLPSSCVGLVDHPGVNNAFLVRTQDPVAILYNDQSVLENAHAASLFALMTSKPTANILASFSNEDRARARKTIIRGILATDMGRHFALVKVRWTLSPAPLSAFPASGLACPSPTPRRSQRMVRWRCTGVLQRRAHLETGGGGRGCAPLACGLHCQVRRHLPLGKGEGRCCVFACLLFLPGWVVWLRPDQLLLVWGRCGPGL
jgi:hypothetical protein